MESRKHYTGLTDKQVQESREKHGANVLTPPKRDSLWQVFIGNFEDPVIRILMVAVFLSGGIAAAMYFSEGIVEIAETIGIAIAILLATLILISLSALAFPYCITNIPVPSDSS